MARGIRKQMNYDAELEKIEKQVQRHQKQIKNLEAEKLRLIQQKETDTLKRLNECIQKSGYSVEDALEILSNCSRESSAV